MAIPTSSIARPSKIYPKWDFWFENIPSGNPDVHRYVREVRLLSRVLFVTGPPFKDPSKRLKWRRNRVEKTMRLWRKDRLWRKNWIAASSLFLQFSAIKFHPCNQGRRLDSSKTEFVENWFCWIIIRRKGFRRKLKLSKTDFVEKWFCQKLSLSKTDFVKN
jgi:hypothetical protein